MTAAAPATTWRSLLDVLGVVGPAGVLTAIVYYFGYVSTRAFYAYFGVSVSALNFSPTTYLVRSVDIVFQPAVTLLVAALVVLGAHVVVRTVLKRVPPKVARRVVAVLGCVAVALLGVGLFGLYGGLLGLFAPLALAGSALLAEYVVWTTGEYATPPPWAETLIQTSTKLRRGLVVALTLVATFWAVTYLANARGRATAELFESSLPLQGQALVYSEKDLRLQGFGIGTTSIAGKDSAYGFLHNGLRPLLHANGRWFLLPAGWRRDNGAMVIVLPDDPGHVRVDLVPGFRPAGP
ncbi:hypothetical protein FKR81_21795 [Lentzea tibetensis]|uniref:Uncharacterized protein n=1 Tax=Lentzea tibetensis TaxID=2591470 RepID=A0A563ERN8_9PSEU|nr:hypothetical protein [Lentzea tibetensis]TWP50329.1 hypothetical protein FKR81_21795 [Lentzea tibetensis]